MSLWAVLEPTAVSVQVGESAQVLLRIRNGADVVDEFRVEVVGDPAAWSEVSPAVLRLLPGASATVTVRFAPPRSPDSFAGLHPYAVRVVPTRYPDLVTVPEGILTVAPFELTDAQLVPAKVRGRWGARVGLAVDNFGNAPLTASVAGEGRDDHVRLGFPATSVQVAPGRAAHVRLRVTPARVAWFGPKTSHTYGVVVRPAGGEPVTAPGTYVQRAVFPPWLTRTAALLLGAVIALVALWQVGQPTVTSAATVFTPSTPQSLSLPVPLPPSEPVPAPAPASAAAAPAAAAPEPAPTATAPPVPTPEPKPRPAAPPPPKDPVVTFRDVAMGVCASFSKDRRIVPVVCDGADPAQWFTLHLNSDGWYTLIGNDPTACLDSYPIKNGNAGAVVVATCDGSLFQRWMITEVADNTYNLQDLQTKLALDTDGKNIYAWNRQDSDPNEQWVKTVIR
ncbi:ricin-type beta-trefoil lectin domain protein [Frankia sp. AgKG'84/4]